MERGLLGHQGRKPALGATQRIAFYCVVVRLVGCYGANTLRHAGMHAVFYCCTRTHKQRHLSPERVSVRSAGSACGQRCIVASLQLSWTFNSAGIQLLVVTQDQRAARQPV